MEYFQIDAKPEYGIFDAVTPNYLLPIALEAEDLCRLHKLMRARKVFNVLEFGLAFLTIVMTDALEKIIMNIRLILMLLRRELGNHLRFIQ